MSVGIQRELPLGDGGRSAICRHVRSRIWRGTDYNQLQISPDFLADFNRARSNGYLAQQAGLAFSPVFNPAVPGSSAAHGAAELRPDLLTNSTRRQHHADEPGRRLADFYMTSRAPGCARDASCRTRGSTRRRRLSNGGFSDYNSLQLELRRQFRGGFFGQIELHALRHQHRFGRHGAEPVRSVHGQLPAGAQHRAVGVPRDARRQRATPSTSCRSAQAGKLAELGRARRTRSSAAGRSARSSRGRADHRSASTPAAARSTAPGARTAATRSAATPHSARSRSTRSRTCSASSSSRTDKIYWIDPKVIDTATGAAVGADNLGNTASFTGQVFFNPAAGDVGNLPILAFDGPAQFSIDLALSKRFRLTDRYRFEFKGEAFNLTNTPSFFRGDMDINSTTFGRLTSVNVGSRVDPAVGTFRFLDPEFTLGWS